MADRIEERTMAEQAISLSFKGILRASPIVELQPEQNDVYFNPIYYGMPEGQVSNQTPGNHRAKDFFDGGEGASRYYFPEDPYRNEKVPVTDSIGNYLNFNVGEESTTIGNDELNNGNDASTVSFKQLLAPQNFTQEKVFPVLNTGTLTVGREERVQPEDKDAKGYTKLGGKVSIDSSPYYDSIQAQLIVNNNFDHTGANRSNGVYTIPTDGKQRRTIYKITNPDIREYDALAHFQDNIDIDNYNNNKTIDSFVDVINLKDYVKSKMSKWLGNNTSEVPTGSVIWQYTSLKKWYCYESASWNGIGNPPDIGHYPPMGQYIDDNNYSPSTYQGTVKKGLNHLSALGYQQLGGEGSDLELNQLKEIIPLYKRDYVICDGTTYYIYLISERNKNNVDYQSYDRFIDLFFAIDYTYSDYDKIAKPKVNKLSNGIYKWTDPTDDYEYKTSNVKLDKHFLFTIDLSTMLAFKVLQEEVLHGTSDNGKSACLNDKLIYDRAKAEAWLKKQSIPAQYIFNTLIPPSDSNDGGMYYEYTPAQTVAGKTLPTYKFSIGREVNSFSSLVRYYDHEKASYVNIELWKTAEVQFILDLFEHAAVNRDKILSKNCVYGFQVPNFVQSTDKYTSGVFIGSSPFYWSDEMRMKGVTSATSSCNFNDSSVPHRHIIFMGPKNFTGKHVSQSNQYVEGSIPTITYGMRNLGRDDMPRAENIVSFMTSMYDGTHSPHSNVESYSFAEVAGTYYKEQMVGGMATYVVQMKLNGVDITFPEHPDPRWRNAEPNRGATSEMFLSGTASHTNDEKYMQAQDNVPNGQAEYFTPESISMVPLIKL